MEAVYTFCLQKLDKMYITDVYKRYTKCMHKFVEMWDIFCIQTFNIHFVYKSLLKCGIHFVYKHFV